MSVCRRVGAVVTCSTDWWAFSGSRCTVVWQATRIPTTLNGWPRTRRCGSSLDGEVVLKDRPPAPNTMSRFETEVLTQDGNVEGLGRLNAKWVDGAMSRTPHRRVILDMDSSESPVHGEQEGASYNGHFGSTCYHPLFVFNQFGDCEGAKLRAGNVHSAHEWRQVLEPILSRYEEKGVRRYFRADAAFAKPDIYEYLEERRVFYAIRLPSNKVLQYEIAPLLIRPVGRPPKRPVILYDDFWYRAESWDHARRVVAKVEWHRGELFPRVGFIVTNMTAGPEGVVRFYNGRGTAEQWIKEGKYALNWTRLSCHRFVANRVRLSLFILAYNLGNFLRRLCLPKAVKHWSLRSVQVKLIKMGGRLVRHSRRLDLPVVRGVASSTVVPGSAGSYRPVIAGAKPEGGYNHDFAKRESAPGSRLVFSALSPHWQGT